MTNLLSSSSEQLLVIKRLAWAVALSLGKALAAAIEPEACDSFRNATMPSSLVREPPASRECIWICANNHFHALFRSILGLARGNSGNYAAVYARMAPTTATGQRTRKVSLKSISISVGTPAMVVAPRRV